MYNNTQLSSVQSLLPPAHLRSESGCGLCGVPTCFVQIVYDPCMTPCNFCKAACMQPIHSFTRTAFFCPAIITCV